MASPPLSPWPHRLTALLVGVVFPLIWVGGLVTTYDAGMAVPDWPGTFGYNLFLYPWQTWVFGPWDLFIEHGHRLLGALAGLVSIALLASTFLTRSPAWLQTAATATLLLVCLQGGLGGLRVLGDARHIALIHACVGPLFFAWCVVLAAITSRWWWQAAPQVLERRAEGPRHAARLARWAGLTAVLAAVQLVLGAHLRHVPIDAPPGLFRGVLWFHLLVAALLAGHAMITAWAAFGGWRGERRLLLPAGVLVGLLLLQLVLGGGTWVVKYGFPAPFSEWPRLAGYVIVSDSLPQAVTVTSHVAVGSLILAFSALLAARAGRLLWLGSRGIAPRPGREVGRNHLLREALA